jgi:hypothetical protein
MSSTKSRLKNGSVPRWRQSRDYKSAPRWLAPTNPYAVIPQQVLDELSRSQLPPTKEAYQRRLSELLKAIKENGNGSAR